MKDRVEWGNSMFAVAISEQASELLDSALNRIIPKYEDRPSTDQIVSVLVKRHLKNASDEYIDELVKEANEIANLAE